MFAGLKRIAKQIVKKSKKYHTKLKFFARICINSAKIKKKVYIYNMNRSKFIFAMASLLFAFSCSSEGNNDNESSSSFDTDVEMSSPSSSGKTPSSSSSATYGPGYPKEVPFTLYSFSESSCHWAESVTNAQTLGFAIISSEEKLKTYIECTEGSYPAIDFSKSTLLLAYGVENHLIIPDSPSLQQVSELKYELKINLLPSDSTVVTPWQVPILAGKLAGGSSVELRISKDWGDLSFSTAVINGKRWMAENLNYSGVNGDQGIKTAYGRLYTWEEAKKICPQGWHLPSKAEWEQLITFAGGYEVAGKKLKAKESWYRNGQSDSSGSDDYSFSALAAGKNPEALDGKFGETAWWWSSTQINNSEAYSLSIGSNANFDSIAGINYDKSYRMSVRCVETSP